MANRPRYAVKLTEQEHDNLVALARKSKGAQSLAIRARIILACAKGMSGQDIAERLGVWPQTVSKWRNRFVEHRVEGLKDAPRSGAPVKVGEQETAEILRTTLKHPPSDATRWTTRSFAREAGLSQTTISKVWRRFGIYPDRHGSFSLSSDPVFMERMRDVVGLYIDAKCRALALCLNANENAARRAQPGGLSADGQASRTGVPSLMRDLEMIAKSIGDSGERSQARPFQAFLQKVHDCIPEGFCVELMIDAGGGELGLTNMMWLMRHPRVRPRYTPNWASWLAEMRHWAEVVARKQLMVHLTPLHELRQVLHQARGLPTHRAISWAKSSEDLRIMLTRLDLSVPA